MKLQVSFPVILGVIFIFQSCSKDDPVNPKLIVYPDQGNYGINLLDTVLLNYDFGVVSLSAVLNEEASLRVRVSGERWSMESNTFNQWNVGSYNETDGSRIFTSIHTGTLDGKIGLYPGKTVEVSVYENGNEWASWTKTVNVE